MQLDTVITRFEIANFVEAVSGSKDEDISAFAAFHKVRAGARINAVVGVIAKNDIIASIRCHVFDDDIKSDAQVALGHRAHEIRKDEVF